MRSDPTDETCVQRLHTHCFFQLLSFTPLGCTLHAAAQARAALIAAEVTANGGSYLWPPLQDGADGEEVLALQQVVAVEPSVAVVVEQADRSKLVLRGAPLKFHIFIHIIQSNKR